MSRRVITIIAIVLLLCLVGWRVVHRLFARPAEGAAAVAVPVATALPVRGPIERTMEYAGTLEARATVTVTPKAAGRIEGVAVSEGELVAKGQLLVQMEQEVARLQVQQATAALRAAEAQREKARRGVRPEELDNAKASLAQAEKDLATAQEDFGRAERLYAEGTIAKAKYEEADRQYRSAQTSLENARRGVQMMEQGAGSEEQRMADAQAEEARAQLDLAQLALDETRVTAPIAGRVAKVLADEGNLAGPATPLVALVNENAMVVKVPIPERWYGEFRSNRDRIGAMATFAALPGRQPFAGRLVSVSPTIDPASRTFTAEVEVSDPRKEVAAGMYASVTFALAHADDALLVPATALVTRGGTTGVFAAVGARPTARFLPVTTGIESGTVVQIVEGLDGGERVIVEGNAFLEDGEPVEPGA
jgi:HlyD family secretion protein